MNQYKLCITDPDLMALVKKYREEILNAHKIIEGLIICTTSEEDARKNANKNYGLMASKDIMPSMNSPDVPEVNSVKYSDAWLNDNLTSCEQLADPIK